MLDKKFQAKLQNHTCEMTKDLIMRFIPNSETIAPVNDSEAPWWPLTVAQWCEGRSVLFYINHRKT